jgi:DNA-binding response OmpR family regulator
MAVLGAAKILIVEDDRYISKMYQLKLSLDGFDVQVADNGRIGIEKAKEMQPDIILTDILMPEVDGFEVIRTLKEDSVLKNIPILIMSNLGQEDHIQKGLQLEAMGYIVKSQYTPSKVVDKIKEILSGDFEQD